MNAIRHVILGQPLRCFGQMMTAAKLAEEHGAVLHLTAGCIGRLTGKHPGMASGCMPRDPQRGGDRCRHDLGALCAEEAVEITDDISCWAPDGSPCWICGTGRVAQATVPVERPAYAARPPRAPVQVSRTPVQGGLW